MSKATAEQVVLEIIRQADGELSGKTRLFKAFYFSHLAYFEKNPGVLTDWPIARMPNGPGIDNSDALFDSLVAHGLIDIELYHEGFYPEYRYRLTSKGKSTLSLGENEVSAVARAVAFVTGKTGSELSHFTHEYSRSWLTAKDGEILNIYIDLIPEDDYRRRQAELETPGPLEMALSNI